MTALSLNIPSMHNSCAVYDLRFFGKANPTTEDKINAIKNRHKETIRGKQYTLTLDKDEDVEPVSAALSAEGYFRVAETAKSITWMKVTNNEL